MPIRVGHGTARLPTRGFWAIVGLVLSVLAILLIMHHESLASGQSDGLVFIAERFDDEGNPVGTVDAHWESDDGQVWANGPEDVPINDALVWARQRSATILVQTGEGDTYSAGTKTPEYSPRLWPSEGLTLAPRALAASWWVAVRVPDRRGQDAMGADRIRELLERSPVVSSVQLEAPTAGPDRVRCKVRARSGSEAVRLIDAVLPRDLYDGDAGSGPVVEVIGHG